MKEILTISRRLDNADIFDEAVNNALRLGWKLVKRKVIVPFAQSENFHTYTMLYAEFER